MAIDLEDDFDRDPAGNPIPDSGPGGVLGVAPGPPVNSATDWGSVEKQLRDAAASKGLTYDASDLEGIRRNAGYDVGGTSVDAALRSQLGIYDQRAASNAPRQYDSQSVQGNNLYGSGSGNGSNRPGGSMTTSSYPAFNNSAPTFDDPASKLVEDYALDRFRQRMNPDPNSGTAGYEMYAKQLIEALKGPVYSTSDEAIIKTKAFDAMEQERGQVKQRWMEELSRRGIPPSSGIALDGMLKIDNHYEGLRTQVESSFAQNAIDQTRQQRMQVLDVYGNLANSEEGRMREAGSYAAMPYELQNNAFQRNLQLVGAGGNPQSLLQSALGIWGAGQQQQQTQQQQQQQATTGILQYLGYLFGGA